MIGAGMDVARIAVVHNTVDKAIERHRRIREVAAELGANVGTLIDLPGPKTRIGRTQGDRIELESGAEVRMAVGDDPSTPERIFVDYSHLVDDCRVGDELTLGGHVIISVQRIDGDEIVGRVESGGIISGRTGCNIPYGTVQYGAISDNDRAALDAMMAEGVDMVSVTVNAGRDLRQLALEPHPEGPMVIAKIATMTAVQNLQSIIDDAAGIMVARGSLGAESRLEELPHIQKQVIRDCIAGGLPVITATQLLDSMVKAQAPTRAEATDIANAVFDGTSAVMLGAETAIGDHPALVVETMARIAERSDDQFDHHAWASRVAALRMSGVGHGETAITDAMTIAAARAAEDSKVRALLCISGTGFTVRSMARFRPDAMLLGLSDRERTVRQLSSSWGVTPLQFEAGDADYEERVRLAVNLAKRERYIASGDLIGVLAGISSSSRATDTFRMLRVP